MVLYLNYLFSFFTIIAGPIQRYRQFCLAWERAAQTSPDDAVLLPSLHRAANGMLKILLLSVFFRNVVDTCFQRLSSGEFSLFFFLALFYAYPLFVYFNFSGYCDVVISFARIAGLELPENFDQPYLSRNMIEFWNRWHITLSEWLRDYVFQPLFRTLASRVSQSRLYLVQYFALFATFLLAGIWHGTNANFVVFGFLHGVGMAASMAYRDAMTGWLGKKRAKEVGELWYVILVERIFCMHFVCFTFLFFEGDVPTVLSWFGLPGGLWR